MTAPVNQLWQQIMNLLREHAPAAAREIRLPGPADDIRELQRLVGLTLPDDLVGWWTLMDGIVDRYDQRAGDLVPPAFVPLAVRRVREEYQRLSESTATDPTCCGPGQMHQSQAGDDGGPFCTALVPICRDITGTTLCVDLRPGTDHGMIMMMAPGDGFSATHWGSVTEMLGEIAERLDAYASQAELPNGEKHPVVNDEGMLQWP
ncbi:SMI1/KNR4 family protein [Amycolatopsis keratiniphila]|uniref:SMI1/KNR4 family protein n=1 Tax=Amycolatopsis keratiniphila subsp. keratiniphila TaxID=227715 RepID=A0A1W2M0F2_9PSEU|nr:SMI1/KNR4 family protein [Amycolatopsis keratiniphila]ONF73148.1 SMI1/KNR4 family protein [Amycolatopsis keratiniphila subsp. keratiniphila]